MTKKVDSRARNWTIIVYPDSAPAEWRNILCDMHIPWICSPIHNHDRFENGKPKKPHWHIIILFPSKKSYKQVEEIAGQLKTVRPQPVASIIGMTRYLAHLDDPDKYQYDPKDIVGYCGADPSMYMETANQKKVDKIRIIGEMIEFVQKQGITEFYQLADYAKKKEPDWFDILVNSSTIFMTNYIKSYRYGHDDFVPNNQTKNNKNGDE